MLSKNRILISILFSTIVSISLSCSTEPTLPIDRALDELKERLSKTPRPNQEAEEMALWLSNDLTASDDLYKRIDKSLASLRDQFKDSVPLIDSINFKYPKQPSVLRIKLNVNAILEFHNGNYNDWDSLNNLYSTESIVYSEILEHLKIVLKFKGILNPDFLAAIYRELDGMLIATSNKYSGDWSCLYPWIRDDGKLTFLLRKAWGDCSAGCIFSHFWYIVESDSGWEIIGEWENWQTEPPEWWEKAQMAYKRYYYSKS